MIRLTILLAAMLWPVSSVCQEAPDLSRDTVADSGPLGADGSDATEHEESNSLPFFGPLRGVLRSSLESLHGLTNSWPLAIMALGVLVRALFFPLTIYSTRHQVAMERAMAALKPEIDALKERYGSDVETRDEMILALQKEHGISPFAHLQGCLPLMVQIPILIALFQELLSFEPIQGVSFLWIANLAEPDRLLAWGWQVPWFGDALNALPLVMFGIHVYTALAMSEHGFKASILTMPAVIAALFYPFPSGVLLYWVTSSFIQAFEVKGVRQWIARQT